MSTDLIEPIRRAEEAGSTGSPDPGPLGPLPTLTRRQVALGRRLGPDGPSPGPGGLVGGVSEILGEALLLDRFEFLPRGAGLGRPAVIAQMSWPRLATRVAIGIEPTLAHAIVDRLLGFRRGPAETRLQVTPVEWGILTFLIARGLDHLDARPGPLGPWDLVLDRVGPDPFDVSGLGPIVTWRWRARVGDRVGSIRAWLPETLLALWLADDPPAGHAAPIPLARYADLASEWHAEAGSATLPRGLHRLRPGLILPIDGAALRGTPASPDGPIRLAQRDASGRSILPVRAAPDTSAARLIVADLPRHEPLPREVPIMTAPGDPSPAESAPADAARPDIPVTLAVELGRVNIPLRRLADLKPGDVLELGRHAREPVELTSNGRLVARGELVQIDAELGVRVLSVFL
ncbi:FliM/FliN family flagellar motor switch protein [Tundrisphaera sp. TA3]|uniref:FliM/FliN family flagellar motor switch protein n=1 Tax=Tundrisphaera sp. TA3 TaxID=3435775 RepID=UPI003EC0C674